jgi:hypothetical protein
MIGLLADLPAELGTMPGLELAATQHLLEQHAHLLGFLRASAYGGDDAGTTAETSQV